MGKPYWKRAITYVQCMQPYPHSQAPPLWNINMCMHAGRAWYLFSREHNVIKIGPEFLEQKTFCVLFNQLCVECLVHVYDIQLLIRVVHVNYLLPSLFFLFWVFGYAHTQLRSLFPLSPPWHCSREKKYQALPTCTTSVFALWSGEAWEQGYAATQLSPIPILFLNFWIVHVWCAK